MSKLAVVGVTGLVGQTILQVLEELNLPITEYFFYASSKSHGKKIKFQNNIYIVQELKEEVFTNNFDYAIFSAGAEIAKKYAPIAANYNTIVIDNSSCFRSNPNIPLIVPEVNFSSIGDSKIIANPNCSTIQCVLPLKPLDDKYKIKRIIYSTYQAVSGAGQKGITDFYNTSKGFANQKFTYPIYNNCIPHIDSFEDNGYTREEMKMINETRKILNNSALPITATTVRVPVLNCHSVSINVEFETEFNLEKAISLIATSPGIVLMDDVSNNIYPVATKVSGKNEVFIGRIRRDESIPNGLNMWVVADNLRKGAAANAIQILERLLGGL